MDKKSFIMYKDIKVQIDALPDEEAGQLFKAIYEFQVNGEEKELSPITAMVFLFIKQQFARDHEKYETRVNTSRENGSKGGRPKVAHNLENPVGYDKTQSVKNNPDKPDTVNVTDTVNDKDSNNVLSDFDLFWDAYSKKEKRKDCVVKFKKKYPLMPDIESHVEIIKKWHKTRKWQEGFQPDPLTWLNGERWEDEIQESEIILSEEEQKAEIRREIEERRNRA